MGVLQTPGEPPALPVHMQGHSSACISFGCHCPPHAKGVPPWGRERFLARNNRAQHRTELNSRKYLQITKSTAWQQGHSEGPTRGPFTANPWQELGSSSLLQSPRFPSTFLLAKVQWSFQQKKLPRKRLIYSRRVKKCQRRPLSC